MEAKLYIIQPAFVHRAEAERPADVLQLGGGGFARLIRGRRVVFAGYFVAFGGVALMATGDDVVPGGFTTARTGNYMVEGEMPRVEAVAAVLAKELVAQENVVAGKSCAIFKGFDVPLQAHHAWHFKLDGG